MLTVSRHDRGMEVTGCSPADAQAKQEHNRGMEIKRCLPADAETKKEHDRGVEAPHGSAVGHILGGQGLEEDAGQGQGEQHAQLGSHDAPGIGPAPGENITCT